MPKPRAPRLLPKPYQLGSEPDAFNPVSMADQEQLGSLAYLSGASTGVNDNNAAVAKFIGNLSNSVYSQYMNRAGAF